MMERERGARGQGRNGDEWTAGCVQYGQGNGEMLGALR
jgi:hypothetical protein